MTLAAAFPPSEATALRCSGDILTIRNFASATAALFRFGFAIRGQNNTTASAAGTDLGIDSYTIVSVA